MATTTKKTTKAKTKTSASSAKKPIKKTSAAKTTARSTTKAAAVKKTRPARVTRTPKKVTLASLRKLHVTSIVVFLLLAVAAALLMKSDAVSLSFNHVAKNEFAAAGQTVLAPASSFVYDLQVRWAVVAILVLSAIMPLLYVTKLQKRYGDYLQTSRMQPYRWVDLAVTSALIMEVVALLSGVSDILTLKLVGGLLAITAVLGLIAERQNNTSDKPVWSAYYTSLFSGLLPWLLVAGYAIATVVLGSSRSPWYVYALYVVAFVGFGSLALTQYNQHKKVKALDSLAAERRYVVTSMLVKVAFAVVLTVGLLRSF